MTEVTREWAKMSLITWACKWESICEKLRTIYDRIYELPESDFKQELTELLTDAMFMGKKMEERLQYYKVVYEGDTTGHAGANLKPIPDYEERWTKRQARVNQDAAD